MYTARQGLARAQDSYHVRLGEKDVFATVDQGRAAPARVPISQFDSIPDAGTPYGLTNLTVSLVRFSLLGHFLILGESPFLSSGPEKEHKDGNCVPRWGELAQVRSASRV